MKHILTALILFLFSQSVKCQMKQFRLEDFKVVESPVQEGKSSIYFLTLNDSSQELTIRTLAKPIEIVASYFDEKYFVIVYNSKWGHYLTGVYKDEESEKWIQDYFHLPLDANRSWFTSNVSSVKFLDGETVLLTCKVHEVGKEPVELVRILRIGKNYIRNYISKDDLSDIPKGNNPIRPIH